MNKAEEFIQENTKDFTNKSLKKGEYYLWLTPSEARKAVEIAREEMIERAIKWVEYNNENGGCKFDGWVDDLKQEMKDEEVR